MDDFQAAASMLSGTVSASLGASPSRLEV